jgi:hypothetical protein
MKHCNLELELELQVEVELVSLRLLGGPIHCGIKRCCSRTPGVVVGAAQCDGRGPSAVPLLGLMGLRILR